MAYVVEKAGLYRAVIYLGVEPITGRERRRWHRCADRPTAMAVARRLGAQRGPGSSIRLGHECGDHLLGRWLPSREASLSPTTYARYVTSAAHYLLPYLGHVELRRRAASWTAGELGVFLVARRR